MLKTVRLFPPSRFPAIKLYDFTSFDPVWASAFWNLSISTKRGQIYSNKLNTTSVTGTNKQCNTNAQCNSAKVRTLHKAQEGLEQHCRHAKWPPAHPQFYSSLGKISKSSQLIFSFLDKFPLILIITCLQNEKALLFPQ